MEEIIVRVEFTKEREFRARVEYSNGQVSTLKSKSLEELLGLVVEELQEYFDANP
ncbi:MAG: hypothetical protein N3F63_06520 [Thermoplasmata archaeon]|nr:hypothetical protein [Thermoplasmata archaeon]